MVSGCVSAVDAPHPDSTKQRQSRKAITFFIVDTSFLKFYNKIIPRSENNFNEEKNFLRIFLISPVCWTHDVLLYAT